MSAAQESRFHLSPIWLLSWIGLVIVSALVLTILSSSIHEEALSFAQAFVESAFVVSMAFALLILRLNTRHMTWFQYLDEGQRGTLIGESSDDPIYNVYAEYTEPTSFWLLIAFAVGLFFIWWWWFGICPFQAWSVFKLIFLSQKR